MEKLRQAFAIEAKLKDCQKAAKFLYKDEYELRLMPFFKLIKAHQAKHKTEILPAVLALGRTDFFTEDSTVGALRTMCLMAAAVELVENPKYNQDEQKPGTEQPKG